ncbi:MAG: 3-isopropylmalate dehydratase small subunit [Gallicola sp.]|nr:3-isopropylmalate dehydratase small subunit [Gallicola sp.]
MGKVYKYGDNIDTDVIIPARYLNQTDPDELKKHCMYDIDQKFNEVVRHGDFIVGGENFGCGSSREHAPLAIKSSGVKAVIAKSYARIFYRNSFNIGMPIMESSEAVDKIENGDEIEVDFSTGEIKNITKGETYHANPIPEFMQKLIDDGGLVEYVKNK